MVQMKMDVQFVMFSLQWFLTLFTLNMPWNTAIRIWDMFMFEGIKIIFRMGMTICHTMLTFRIGNTRTGET